MAKGNAVKIDEDAIINKIAFEATLEWLAVRLSNAEREQMLDLLRQRCAGGATA